MLPMSKQDITVLLQRVNNGEKGLLNDIYTKMYSEIKAIAQYQINKLNTGKTITPTVLSHDCYLKMIKQNKIDVKNSNHFLNCLSISMRQLLIDIYRSKLSIKNKIIKGDISLESIAGENDINFKVIEIDQLLNKIKRINVQYCEVLNYKLILSMTFTEISLVIGKSERQVIRIWNQAKALLLALSKEKNKNGPRSDTSLEKSN